MLIGGVGGTAGEGKRIRQRSDECKKDVTTIPGCTFEIAGVVRLTASSQACGAVTRGLLLGGLLPDVSVHWRGLM